MTKAECIKLIREWCGKNGKKLISPPRHVHTRSYILAKLAERCLLVSSPWQDAETHMIGDAMTHPTRQVHFFDKTLKPGEFCMTAYVSTEGCGEQVAVPIPWPVTKKSPPKKKRTATKARSGASGRNRGSAAR